MTSPRAFPDIEEVLVVLLEDLAGGPEHTGGETPVDLADVLPFVRVRRIDGGSDQINDVPNIDVDVFAPTRAVGWPLANSIREFLTPRRPPSPLLDRISCDVGPRELPWGDGVIRRWGASYVVVARRAATG